MSKFTKLIRVALLSCALCALFVVGASAASLGVATVTTDALRLRAEPSASADILATAPARASVIVLENAGGGWYRVDYRTITGYMSADYLSLSETVQADLGYAYIDTDSSTLNLRADAGTEHAVLASIPGRSVLPISGMKNGWYQVTYAGKTGYVSSDYVLLVLDETGARADGNGKQPAAPAAANGTGAEIAAYAQNYLGCRYVYGGNGPNSFDCSGFTKYIYAQFGYTLNRTATDQLQNGVAVSKSELQPGDLVFFKYNTSKPVSHVGIYIGDGQFIHASTNSYVVRIDNLTTGHYNNVYVYARRVV